MSARVVPDMFTSQSQLENVGLKSVELEVVDGSMAPAASTDARIVPLSTLRAGDTGVICRLDEEADETITHRLQLLGFDCGREVCLIRQAPLRGPMVFRVCDAQMCLRQAQADMIFVRLSDDAVDAGAPADLGGVATVA